MFCHNCGAQLPENAAFCPNCGQKITPISQPVSIQKPEAPPAEPVDAPVDSTDAPNETPQPGPQTDNTVPLSGTVTEAEVIGSNAAYYQAQFQKIRAGEKGNFNVAAFFLTLYHAAYRGPWREWLEFMSIPLRGYVVAITCLWMSMALPSSSPSVDPLIYYVLGMVGSILSIIFCIWWIISSIRYGFVFNNLYRIYVEKQLQAEKPICGTSTLRTLLSILAVLAISVIVSITSIALDIYLI